MLLFALIISKVYNAGNPKKCRLKQTRIEVKGYTDKTGPLDYNLSISDLRANLIKNYLTNKGIQYSRIEAKGLGPKNPIGGNETIEEKRLNRRVEIDVYSKKPR